MILAPSGIGRCAQVARSMREIQKAWCLQRTEIGVSGERGWRRSTGEVQDHHHRDTNPLDARQIQAVDAVRFVGSPKTKNPPRRRVVGANQHHVQNHSIVAVTRLPTPVSKTQGTELGVKIKGLEHAAWISRRAVRVHRSSFGLAERKGERTPGKLGEPGRRCARPSPRQGGRPGTGVCPVPEVSHGEGYIPFIASHDTFGFMSAKAPVGFCFQAQTCSS